MRRTLIALALAAAACREGTAKTNEAAPVQSVAEKTPSPGDSVQVGDFFYVGSRDAMTDRDESRVFVFAKDAPPASVPILMWRCGDRDVELIVHADDFIDSHEPARVQWRLDDAPPSTPVQWSVSTTGTGVFAPDQQLVEITRGAMAAKRLRVRITDYQGTPHDLQFPLEGAPAAFKKLDCGIGGPAGKIARFDSARALAEGARRAAEARKNDPRVIADKLYSVYAPVGTNCWKNRMAPERIARDTLGFPTAAAAEKAGYRTSDVCYGGTTLSEPGAPPRPGR